MAVKEQEKIRRHPGVAFEGEYPLQRRATLIGTVFDVWEVVDLYKIEGREALLRQHPISEELLQTALSYYRDYPAEIDAIIEENNRPSEYWMELYPELNWKS